MTNMGFQAGQCNGSVLNAGGLAPSSGGFKKKKKKTFPCFSPAVSEQNKPARLPPVFTLAVRADGRFWRKRVTGRRAVNFLWELPRPTPAAAPLPLEHEPAEERARAQRRTGAKSLNKLTVNASKHAVSFAPLSPLSPHLAFFDQTQTCW